MKNKPVPKVRKYEFGKSPYKGIRIDSITESTDPSYDRVCLEMTPKLADRIIELLEWDDSQNQYKGTVQK